MIKLLPKDKNSDIMNKKQFQMIVDKLAHSSPKKISLDYKIPYERASLLLPCSIVLQTFFRQSKAESVVVPKVEFCDGIVADYVYQQKKNSINQDFDQDIIMTANNIAKRYRCDKEFPSSAPNPRNSCKRAFPRTWEGRALPPSRHTWYAWSIGCR